jgi:hypothetical protein
LNSDLTLLPHRRKTFAIFVLVYFSNEKKTEIHQVLFVVLLSLIVFTPERPWHCVKKSVSINHIGAEQGYKDMQ